MFSYSIKFSAYLSAIVLIANTNLFAYPKGTVELEEGLIYSVSGNNRSNVHCAKIEGKFLSGKAFDSTHFRTTAREIQSIKAQIRRLNKRGASTNGLQSRLENLLSNIKQRNRICRNNPTLGGDESSLEPQIGALSRDDVRYFLEKAGFGLSGQDEFLVEIALNGGVSALVDTFMQVRSEDNALLERVANRLDGTLSSNTQQTPSGQRAGLFDLWTHTRNPYVERLAKFILSVWTVAGDVIADETFRAAFWDYYAKLRTCASSECDLKDLALKLTTDPLMLIYLNNELNVKGSPNENYARELMELFTLGPSNLDGTANYTETKLDGSGDIAVAARMLTGFKVKLDYQINKLVTQYDGNRHEPGTHTMFAGTAYEFSGQNYEDLINGIFAHHPNVKYYYAKEILKAYLTPEPPRALIENFGAVIANNNYKLAPALATLFKSQAFFHAKYRDTLPKDSIDFAVEIIRLLGLQDGFNPFEASNQSVEMGMPINLAPSVFWFDANSWTSPAILMARANFVANILGDTSSHALASPAWSISSSLPSGTASADAVIDYVSARLGVPINENLRASLKNYVNTAKEYDGKLTSITYVNTDLTLQKQKGGGLYYILALSPQFQLK